MSMAVIDDSPNEQPAIAPSLSDRIYAAQKHNLKLGLRRLRRRVLVRIRNVFQIEEDLVRDRLVDGLRRDLEAASVALAQAVTGLNMLHERLQYHEANIPRMRTLRTEFDRGKRAEILKRDAAVEEAVEAEHETTERRSLGLL